MTTKNKKMPKMCKEYQLIVKDPHGLSTYPATKKELLRSIKDNEIILEITPVWVMRTPREVRINARIEDDVSMLKIIQENEIKVKPYITRESIKKMLFHFLTIAKTYQIFTPEYDILATVTAKKITDFIKENK